MFSFAALKALLPAEKQATLEEALATLQDTHMPALQAFAISDVMDAEAVRAAQASLRAGLSTLYTEVDLVESILLDAARRAREVFGIAATRLQAIEQTLGAAQYAVAHRADPSLPITLDTDGVEPDARFYGDADRADAIAVGITLPHTAAFTQNHISGLPIAVAMVDRRLGIATPTSSYPNDPSQTLNGDAVSHWGETFIVREPVTADVTATGWLPSSYRTGMAVRLRIEFESAVRATALQLRALAPFPLALLEVGYDRVVMNAKGEAVAEYAVAWTAGDALAERGDISYLPLQENNTPGVTGATFYLTIAQEHYRQIIHTLTKQNQQDLSYWEKTTALATLSAPTLSGDSPAFWADLPSQLDAPTLNEQISEWTTWADGVAAQMPADQRPLMQDVGQRLARIAALLTILASDETQPLEQALRYEYTLGLRTLDFYYDEYTNDGRFVTVPLELDGELRQARLTVGVLPLEEFTDPLAVAADDASTGTVVTSAAHLAAAGLIDEATRVDGVIDAANLPTALPRGHVHCELLLRDDGDEPRVPLFPDAWTRITPQTPVPIRIADGSAAAVDSRGNIFFASARATLQVYTTAGLLADVALPDGLDTAVAPIISLATDDVGGVYLLCCPDAPFTGEYYQLYELVALGSGTDATWARILPATLLRVPITGPGTGLAVATESNNVALYLACKDDHSATAYLMKMVRDKTLAPLLVTDPTRTDFTFSSASGGMKPIAGSDSMFSVAPTNAGDAFGLKASVNGAYYEDGVSFGSELIGTTESNPTAVAAVNTRSLASDESGLLAAYLGTTDGYLYEVERFKAAPGDLLGLQKLTDDNGTPLRPGGFCIDRPRKLLYLADPMHHCIRKYYANGDGTLRYLGFYGLAHVGGTVYGPGWVDVSVLTDVANLQYDAGNGVGSYNSPGDVATTASGDLVVADTGNHRLVVLHGSSVIGWYGKDTTGQVEPHVGTDGNINMGDLALGNTTGFSHCTYKEYGGSYTQTWTAGHYNGNIPDGWYDASHSLAGAGKYMGCCTRLAKDPERPTQEVLCWEFLTNRDDAGYRGGGQMLVDLGTGADRLDLRTTNKLRIEIYLGMPEVPRYLLLGFSDGTPTGIEHTFNLIDEYVVDTDACTLLSPSLGVQKWLAFEVDISGLSTEARDVLRYFALEARNKDSGRYAIDGAAHTGMEGIDRPQPAVIAGLYLPAVTQSVYTLVRLFANGDSLTLPVDYPPMPGTEVGAFNSPGGVNIPLWSASDAHYGEIFVADTGNARVVRYSDLYALIDTYGSRYIAGGDYDGAFSQPRGVGVAGDLLCVTDPPLNRVALFNLSSDTFTGWIGNGRSSGGSLSSGYHASGSSLQPVEGTETGGFVQPGGITVTDDDTLYIADRSDRVQHLTTGGLALTGGMAGSGSTPGLLDDPVSLDIAATGDLYIAEAGNGRTQTISGSTRIAWRTTCLLDPTAANWPYAASRIVAVRAALSQPTNNSPIRYAYALTQDGELYTFRYITSWERVLTTMFGSRALTMGSRDDMLVATSGDGYAYYTLDRDEWRWLSELEGMANLRLQEVTESFTGTDADGTITLSEWPYLDLDRIHEYHRESYPARVYNPNRDITPALKPFAVEVRLASGLVIKPDTSGDAYHQPGRTMLQEISAEVNSGDSDGLFDVVPRFQLMPVTLQDASFLQAHTDMLRDRGIDFTQQTTSFSQTIGRRLYRSRFTKWEGDPTFKVGVLLDVDGKGYKLYYRESTTHRVLNLPPVDLLPDVGTLIFRTPIPLELQLTINGSARTVAVADTNLRLLAFDFFAPDLNERASRAVPYTYNVTDYLRGYSPAVKYHPYSTEAAPDSEAYYPVLDYTQQGRTLHFNRTFTAEEGAEIRVRYWTMALRPRLCLSLRRQPTGAVMADKQVMPDTASPLIHRLDLSVGRII